CRSGSRTAGRRGPEYERIRECRAGQTPAGRLAPAAARATAPSAGRFSVAVQSAWSRPRNRAAVRSRFRPRDRVHDGLLADLLAGQLGDLLPVAQDRDAVAAPNRFLQL